MVVQYFLKRFYDCQVNFQHFFSEENDLMYVKIFVPVMEHSLKSLIRHNENKVTYVLLEFTSLPNHETNTQEMCKYEKPVGKNYV